MLKRFQAIERRHGEENIKEYVERKENCHDKCLMSLALALPKQNKSVIEI